MVSKYEGITIWKLNFWFCLIMLEKWTEHKLSWASSAGALNVLGNFRLGRDMSRSNTAHNHCCFWLLGHCWHVGVICLEHVWLVRVEVEAKRLIMWSYEVFRFWRDLLCLSNRLLKTLIIDIKMLWPVSSLTCPVVSVIHFWILLAQFNTFAYENLIV